jgi:hypothetical protein
VKPVEWNCRSKNKSRKLEHFGKTGVCPINTPALANEHLHKLNSPEIDAKSYQRALGAIMYPMLGT